MTPASPISDERLRQYIDTCLTVEGRQMARELLSLRAALAQQDAVAEADRKLVDCIIGVGLEGMKPRRAGDPVCPEGYILVGLPFYDACRAARAAEGGKPLSQTCSECGYENEAGEVHHCTKIPASPSASPLQGQCRPVGSEAGCLEPGPLAAAQLDDVQKRLLAACSGYPAATIPWPHRLLHDAFDTPAPQEGVERLGEMMHEESVDQAARALNAFVRSPGPQQTVAEAAHVIRRIEAVVLHAAALRSRERAP